MASGSRHRKTLLEPKFDMRESLLQDKLRIGAAKPWPCVQVLANMPGIYPPAVALQNSGHEEPCGKPQPELVAHSWGLCRSQLRNARSAVFWFRSYTGRDS